MGRHSTCDIRIQDPRLSRRHAEVSIANEQYKITDLGSANGVLINGDRLIGSQMLHHGDLLVIGPLASEVVVEASDPPTSAIAFQAAVASDKASTSSEFWPHSEAINQHEQQQDQNRGLEYLDSQELRREIPHPDDLSDRYATLADSPAPADLLAQTPRPTSSGVLSAQDQELGIGIAQTVNHAVSKTVGEAVKENSQSYLDDRPMSSASRDLQVSSQSSHSSHSSHSSVFCLGGKPS